MRCKHYKNNNPCKLYAENSTNTVNRIFANQHDNLPISLECLKDSLMKLSNLIILLKCSISSGCPLHSLSMVTASSYNSSRHSWEHLVRSIHYTVYSSSILKWFVLRKKENILRIYRVTNRIEHSLQIFL